jgi:hypothetical protein
MAAVGLALIAVMTRPAAKVPFPTVLCLAFLPGGMIEFIVTGPPYCAIRVGHGLLASVRQIDNRHPPVPQDDVRISMHVRAIGSPIDLGMCHPFSRCPVFRGNWPSNFQETSDAAHSLTMDQCKADCQRLWHNAYTN